MKTTAELKEIISEIQKRGDKFCYMMLNRLQMDCGYFLNCGEKGRNHLWTGDEHDQVELMRLIWNILPEEPEWFNAKLLEEYIEEMLPSNWYSNFSVFEWQEDDSFICKASKEALELLETQSLPISLLWESSLDFALAGEDGCISNYDMYTPLYSYKTDKLYLIPHSESQKWKEGETIRIYGREMDEEERKSVEEFMES